MHMPSSIYDVSFVSFAADFGSTANLAQQYL